MNIAEALKGVIATCLKLADRGYLAGTSGNVACLIDDGHFAITPSACDYYSLTVSDICVLRLSDLAQVAGDRAPSVERGLHAKVLRMRADCEASIHTHQPIASAYSLLGHDLEVTRPEHQAVLGKKALCAGYAPSGTGWLASKLERRLQPDVDAYLLRNHGVVCCGATLADAVARVEALEDACRHFFCDAIASRKTGGSDPWATEVMESLLQTQSGETIR